MGGGHQGGSMCGRGLLSAGVPGLSRRAQDAPAEAPEPTLRRGLQGDCHPGDKPSVSHLPEVHSLQVNLPSGLRDRPRQARWKAPQQGPSHSRRPPVFSHSWAEGHGQAQE